ncbi:MAG TPA: hypothetical protein VGA24_02845 [Steroidobacteraceae bacterium]
MRDTSRHFTAIACALGLLFLASAASLGQNTADADTREIMADTLTEAALGRYVQATRNLSGLQIDDCDDDSDVGSLSEAVAKLDATPGAKAAVQSAGMTTREYIVFAFSLIQNGLAAWTLDQPGGTLPPGISQANVDFFREHAAEMEELGAESGDASCDTVDESEDGA